jgi:hypothetical protein
MESAIGSKSTKSSSNKGNSKGNTTKKDSKSSDISSFFKGKGKSSSRSPSVSPSHSEKNDKKKKKETSKLPIAEKLDLHYQPKLEGPTKKIDNSAKQQLMERIKNIGILGKPKYLDDIATIVTNTTPDYEDIVSENSNSTFFVMDDVSDYTFSLLFRYVQFVYQKHAKDFSHGGNASFYRLFTDISSQLESEGSLASQSEQDRKKH